MIEFHDTLAGHVQLIWIHNKKHDTTFYARWTIRGQKRSHRRLGRTERHPTAASLRNWEAKYRLECQAIENEILSGQTLTLPVEAPRATIAEAQADFVAFMAGPPARVSRSTLIRRTRVYSEFRHYIGSTVATVDQITADHLTGKGDSGTRPGFRYAREAMEVGPATIVTEMYDLKKWLDYCEERGWLAAVPRLDLPTIPQRRRPAVPTDEQVRAIIGTGEPCRQAALTLLALTGIRRGELRALDVGSFDPGAGTLAIPRSLMETNKRHERTTPMGEQARELLAGLAADRTADEILCRAPNGDRINGQMDRWFAGTGFTPHDLRRWFQTTLTREGCPQGYIDELMGHCGNPTDRAYVAANLDDLRPWMAKIEARLMPAPVTT